MNNWHTSGGNNHRSGLSHHAVKMSSVSPKIIQCNGSVTASAVFDQNGTAYIADRAGTVQAVSAEGKSLWNVNFREGFHASPACSHDGSLLFLASVHGKMMAVRTSDGSSVWKKKVVRNNDPRILADVLYLPKSNCVLTSTWEEELIAVDGHHGEIKQTWNAGLTPVSAASADNDETIFAVRAHFSWDNPEKNGIQLIRIFGDGAFTETIHSQPSPKDAGKEMWTAAAPVIDEKRERVYYISNILEEGILHCVDLKSDTQLWQKKYDRQIQATPCLTPVGQVVVGDMFGNVTAYDVGGDQTYQYKTGAAFILGSLVCDANGVVFVGDNEGGVHRITPNGKGEKRFEAERSIEGRFSISPGGQLFIPCMDGNVYVMS